MKHYIVYHELVDKLTDRLFLYNNFKMNTISLIISTKKPLKAKNNICQDFDKYYIYYYKDLYMFMSSILHTQLNDIPTSAYTQFSSFEDFLDKVINIDNIQQLSIEFITHLLPTDFIKSVESDFKNETLEYQISYVIHSDIFKLSIQSLIQQYNMTDLLAIRCCYDCMIQYIHDKYDKFTNG